MSTFDPAFRQPNKWQKALALLKNRTFVVMLLLGFGSGNPITDENYSKGQFTSYQGKALAVLRAGYEAGEAKLAVSAEGLGKSEICLQVK